MHIRVNGTRLFFDIEGMGWVPEGPILRQKPTLLLLHGGPGFDHSTWRNRSGAAGAAAALSLHKGVGLRAAALRGAKVW
jgi:proline iminopeptidase